MPTGMDLHALLTRIASTEFAANVYVADGFGIAERIVRAQPAFVELVAALRGDRALLPRVLAHVRSLSSRDVDRRYSSPHDVSLFALVTALGMADAGSQRIAAAFALRAPQTWLAAKAAAAVFSAATDGLSITSASRSVIADRPTGTMLAEKMPFVSFDTSGDSDDVIPAFDITRFEWDFAVAAASSQQTSTSTVRSDFVRAAPRSDARSTRVIEQQNDTTITPVAWLDAA